MFIIWVVPWLVLLLIIKMGTCCRAGNPFLVELAGIGEKDGTTISTHSTNTGNELANASASSRRPAKPTASAEIFC